MQDIIKFMWVSPWDEFITEINQNSFGELWINKGFESKKRRALFPIWTYMNTTFILHREKPLAHNNNHYYFKTFIKSLGYVLSTNLVLGWNLDQKKHGSHTSQAKLHEDQDGMVETKSAIILIHLQDEMMPIQAKMQWRSPAQWT